MNKCFITKLPSSVDNDNLPVLGQLRIDWLKQNDLTDNDQRYIELSTTDSITVKVSGAHFTDSTLSSNLGNTKTIKATDGTVGLYVSNDADAVLTIDNKYSLTVLSFVHDGKYTIKRSVYFDINDIKYCANLNDINILETSVYGDINALSNLTNVTRIMLNDTQVSGDISALSNLTNLHYAQLDSTQVSGDISALSNLTNLYNLSLNDTQVSGDISALSNLTNLTSLSLSSTQVSGDISALSNLTNLYNLSLNDTQVSGDISVLSNFTNLNSLSNLRGLSLTGDMSKIPANVRYINLWGRIVNTNFTWTANGRQNATLLAMEGNVPFDTASMDNMLIDQATCTVSPSATTSRQKIISVNGTRTAASDAAVTAIQNMGITITGVTKQA